MRLWAKHTFQLLLLCALLALSVATASAGEVRVGIGFSLPPYVIRESDSGMEVDIVREACASPHPLDH